ncbi:acylneuraminate cytidylyltransferase family protein [Paenibacillus albus]|uniref:Acylneuraminate cytidylyltransferase family protein n=1 Tax=Paenibacillus albus TaxID=2495582 RepID=A0A3Q8X1S8_9BACL|nr:acylneuraminate cytidylyltransferase family protein [Paenibacillus albus]AZN38511.1 acylneuraminate cytidylyltransferase family protein [Paenibacillus albus]
MIKGQKVLAIIPARGGSKGLPNKNIRLLQGKPLIAWSIEAAAQSQYVDTCIVTTDSFEIAAAATEWGGQVPFMRPSELAQDDTPGMLPILHALRMVKGYDIVLLLQPTSPLRTAEDIDHCLEQLVASRAWSVVSVTENDKPLSWMYQLGDEQQTLVKAIPGLENVLQRQDAAKIYVLNGAVYAAYIPYLLSNESFMYEGTAGYVMPKERSVDIDTMIDFIVAESLLQIRN